MANGAHLTVVRDDLAIDDEPIKLANPKVTVVIPTLNEERNIAWVINRLPPMVDEVILVDGRSTDRTVAVALAIRPDIVVVREPRPGKGIALRTAFAAATGDIIVMLDADCSMDPGEIPVFVEAIEDGADLVKGSRFLNGGGSVDISLLRQLGNRALLLMTNILYARRFSELCYGFMAFRRTALPRLALESTGFEIETELVVRSIKSGLRVAEVPSFESARAFGVSNLHTFRDGWRVARTVLQHRFRTSPMARVDPSTGLHPVAVPVPVSVQEPQVRSES